MSDGLGCTGGFVACESSGNGLSDGCGFGDGGGYDDGD